MKTGSASVEQLYHYKCPDCELFWSIGDAHLSPQQTWTCPHCQQENTKDEGYQTLVHYQCPHCKGWWTMAEQYADLQHNLHCPWCKGEADYSQRRTLPDLDESVVPAEEITLRNDSPHKKEPDDWTLPPTEEERQERSKSFAGKVLNDEDQATKGIDLAYPSMERFEMQEMVASMIVDNSRLLLTGGVQVLAKMIVDAFLEPEPEIAEEPTQPKEPNREMESKAISVQQEEFEKIAPHIHQLVSQIHLYHQGEPVTDEMMLKYMKECCNDLEASVDIKGLYELILKKYTKQKKQSFQEVKTNTPYDSILYNWLISFAAQLPEPARSMLHKSCNALVHHFSK